MATPQVAHRWEDGAGLEWAGQLDAAPGGRYRTELTDGDGERELVVWPDPAGAAWSLTKSTGRLAVTIGRHWRRAPRP